MREGLMRHEKATYLIPWEPFRNALSLGNRVAGLVG